MSAGTALSGVAAALLLMAPTPSRAADECGAAADGAVNCTAAGDPYAGGISYSPTDDLTVNLGTGVAIDTGATNNTRGVNLAGNGNASAVTAADGVTVTTGGNVGIGIFVSGNSASATGGAFDVTTTGNYSAGILVNPYYGTGTIINGGTISTAGRGSAGASVYGEDSNIAITVNDIATTGEHSAGVVARNYTSYGSPTGYTSIVTVNGAITTSGGEDSAGVYAHDGIGTVEVVDNGSIATTGGSSIGIDAVGASGVTISGAGSVSTTGDYATGISVNGDNGNADVSIGSVTTTGYGAAGIVAHASGDVTVNAGDVSTAGGYSDGIRASADADAGVSVTSTGTISTTGNGSDGVYAISYGTGAIGVTVNNVTTTGDYADGVYARNSAAAPTADVSVKVTGAVSTGGIDATGIYAFNNYGSASIENDGSVTTSGDGAVGLYVGGYVDATVTGRGSVTTTGDDARGIYANGQRNVSVTTGAVSTSGAGSTGIYAFSYTGDVTVDATSVATTGDNSLGIYAATDTDSAGAVSVTAGTVSTQGAASDGIYAASHNGGDLTVNSTASVSTVTDGSIGIDAIGSGGAVNVSAVDVATLGDNADAIHVTDGGDGPRLALAPAVAPDMAVTVTGTVSTAGDQSKGVYAVSYAGAVSVEDDGSISTGGTSSTGIYAEARGGSAVTVTGTGSVSTAGDDAPGVVAQGGSADVTLGSVTTTGENSIGIFAFGMDGDSSVNAGSVSTTGYGSAGVVGLAYGNVTIDTTSVTTVGDRSVGIYALGGIGEDSGGSVSVTAGTVATEGGTSDGITAKTLSGGDISVVSTGSVSTQGDTSIGIDAIGTGGAVNVSAVDVSTLGAYSDAIHAINSPTQGEDSIMADALPVAAAPDMAVTVTGNVSTAGTRSMGVYAFNQVGAVSVENDGAISTGGSVSDGIVAVGAAGDVTVSGAGSVTTAGDYSYGIFALAYGTGNTSVTTGAVSTAGKYSVGIGATADYGDTTVSATSVATTGYGAKGIYARAGYGGLGSVSVTAGTVSTQGDRSDGIYARTYSGGDVAVNSTGSVSTQGDTSVGIYAIGTGAVNVAAVDVSTLGNDSDAIRLRNTPSSEDEGDLARPLALAAAASPDMAVTVTGNVSTAGDRSDGIYAANYVGATSVENDGVVSTAGADSTGIVAYSAVGQVTVAGRGSVTTTGDNSLGIFAEGSGPLSVTAGAVSTSGQDSIGIDAQGRYDVTVDATSVTTTLAPTSIEASSYVGAVTVTTGTVLAASSGSYGIEAFGRGDVLVHAGATTGDRGAITASSNEGFATVEVSGATVSKSGDAIRAHGATGAAVTVASTGSVTGATNAIVIAGGAAPVDGGGGEVEQQARAVRLVAGAPRLLAAAAGAGVGGTTVTNAGTITGGSGYAVLASGGPALIDNSGTIKGRVSLTANDDQFVNSGTFATTGTSEFGAGTDSFVNSGTVKASGITTFANLESFTNAGTISLVNGTIGDHLEIGGNYVGADGTLALDVNFSGATPTGDLLTIDGDASGTTNVVLNGTQAPTLGTRLIVVDVAGSSPATAFTIAGGQAQQSGFVVYSIQYDPALTDYYLTAVAGPGVFRGLKMNEAAQSLWYKTADAWSAHMLDIGEVMRGNAPAPAGRVWGQLYGSVSKRSDGRIYTSGTVTQNIDLSYRQDYYGGQIGVDLGSTGETGGFVFGATGGYLSSALTFRGVADNVDYDDYNAGVYAGFTGGPFFINGLAKYDFYQIDAKSGSIGYRDKFHGHSYGAMGEAGFRFGSDSFHFDPVASIAYTRTDLGTLKALGSTIDFDQLDGLRGKAGLRIGGSSPIAHGSTITYYAGGSVVKEFKGRDGIVFASGLTTLGLRNDRLPTYGEFRAGVNIVSANGVTGFLEGNTDYSKDYKGYGGRVGLRAKF